MVSDRPSLDAGLPRPLRLLAMTKWWAVLACYVSGAVAAVAFAPFYAWPLLLLALPLFYLLLTYAPSWRQAVLRGFAFGYGYFMAGTWWIANALLVDAAKFGWLMPVSILGLSAVLGLYFAGMAALYYPLRRASVIVNLLRFAVVWVGVEYLRSLGFFGFPWNLLGYSALGVMNLAQGASLVGVFGLSLLVLLIALVPVLFIVKSRRWVALVPVAAVVAVMGYGAARMVPTVYTTTTLRVVQPNLPQAIKGTREGQQESIRLLGELSPSLTQAEVTIWPETAYPFTYQGGSAMMWAPRGTLITGAVRAEGEGESFRIYNSILAIGERGAIHAQYDKHQLVPFGEFVPLRSVLPLEKITPGNIDFSRGVGAVTLTFGGLPPVSPLVCYEVIFPWMAVNGAVRPEWMVNVTNDAWYGDSPGPYQHLATAQMRAIEQGLPLVRAANNGVSAVIDPFGRLVAALPLNARGSLESRLPAPLPPTVYGVVGEKLTLGLLVALVLVTFLPTTRRKNK